MIPQNQISYQNDTIASLNPLLSEVRAQNLALRTKMKQHALLAEQQLQMQREAQARAEAEQERLIVEQNY